MRGPIFKRAPRHRRRAIVVLSAVAVLAAVGAGVALATPASWTATEFTNLPSNLNATASDSRSYFFGASCVSAGDCTAVGNYSDSLGSLEVPMATTQTGGTWAQASAIELPGDAETVSDGPYSALYSVSCTAAGDCVGGGYYEDSNGNNDYQAMGATETGGTWAQGVKLPLPSDAGIESNEQDATVNSISCTSTNTCVAVGDYHAVDPDAESNDDVGITFERPVIWTDTDGDWAVVADSSALPNNAAPVFYNESAEFEGVTCTSPGNCVAVGSYTDDNGSDILEDELDYQAMVATETDGTWAAPVEIALPGDEASGAGDQDAEATAVTCTSLGDCVATGGYVTASDNDASMVATEASGTWGQASTIELPANAITTATDQYNELQSIACVSAGNCQAGGYYTDKNGSDDYQAMGATETDGTWSPAVEVTLPSGFLTTAGDQNGDLEAMSCNGVDVTDCVGYGGYVDGSAGDVPMTATFAAAVPVPTISLKKSSISKAKRKATFTFSASAGATSAQCALVKLPKNRHAKAPKPSYSSCKSPKAYSHLAAASYTFYVRAVGPGGDSAAASHKFTL